MTKTEPCFGAACHSCVQQQKISGRPSRGAGNSLTTFLPDFSTIRKPASASIIGEGARWGRSRKRMLMASLAAI